MVNMASGQHGLPAQAPNDDDNIVQHAGHTPAHIRSCSLGLPHVSLLLDIHAMINIIDTCQNKLFTEYHTMIPQAN